MARVRVVVAFVRCPHGMWAIKPTPACCGTRVGVCVECVCAVFSSVFFSRLSSKRVNYRRFVVFKGATGATLDPIMLRSAARKYCVRYFESMRTNTFWYGNIGNKYTRTYAHGGHNCTWFSRILFWTRFFSVFLKQTLIVFKSNILLANFLYSNNIICFIVIKL